MQCFVKIVLLCFTQVLLHYILFLIKYLTILVNYRSANFTQKIELFNDNSKTKLLFLNNS